MTAVLSPADGRKRLAAKLINQLVEVDHGCQIGPEWIGLMEVKGWLTSTGGLTAAGHFALYRHYRDRVAQLEREAAKKITAVVALRRAIRALRKACRTSDDFDHGGLTSWETVDTVKAALEAEFKA